jgi:hypothetical protein
MVLNLYLLVQSSTKLYICNYTTYACHIFQILRLFTNNVHHRPYSAVKCILIPQTDKGILSRKGSSSNIQCTLLEHGLTSTHSLSMLHILNVGHSIQMTPLVIFETRIYDTHYKEVKGLTTVISAHRYFDSATFASILHP